MSFFGQRLDVNAGLCDFRGGLIRLTPASTTTSSKMPVQRLDNRVVLIHPKVNPTQELVSTQSPSTSQGATAELLLYGATVISWKAGSRANSEPAERLFLSSKALLDGSKAVRGGIPIVFPCFGPPTHPEHSRLSQHGFARSESWELDSIVTDNDDGVSVRLSKCNPVHGLPFFHQHGSFGTHTEYHRQIQSIIPFSIRGDLARASAKHRPSCH